jgi:hypothetical protein
MFHRLYNLPLRVVTPHKHFNSCHLPCWSSCNLMSPAIQPTHIKILSLVILSLLFPLSSVILPTRVKFLSHVMSHLLYPLSPLLMATHVNFLSLVMGHLIHSTVTFHTTNTSKIPVTCLVTPPASSCHLSSVQHKQFLSHGILGTSSVSPCLLSYNQHMSISCISVSPAKLTTNVILSCYSFCISRSPVKLTTNVKFLPCHTSRIAVYPPFFIGNVFGHHSICHKTFNLSPLLKINTVPRTHLLQCGDSVI